MGCLQGIQISFDFMLPITEQINYQVLSYEVERQEITNLVRNRLQDMGIPSEDYGELGLAVCVVLMDTILLCPQIIARRNALNCRM